jgi:hypothetical protein
MDSVTDIVFTPAGGPKVQSSLKYPYPCKLYQPLNRCAYCGSTEELSTEHIIPFGFGGKLILPNASCEFHRKATSKIEDFILRKYLSALRSYLSLPSRRPQDRPNGYKLTLRRGGHTWKQKVSLADHPGVVAFMIFDPAGRTCGRSRDPQTFSVRMIKAEIFPDTTQRLARLGADSCEDQVVFNALDLARFTAKIGQCFAVAELGIEAFEEMYVTYLFDYEVIDGKVVLKEARDWNYWVGGYERGREVQAKELHELRFLKRGDDLSVIVHLFVPYCPRYAFEVIVGRLRSGVEIPPELDESL